MFFFIPSGRVHTIGKGLLIAEIQQTSDITYRIYDFDRVDEKGLKRELHTELAIDAIDYSFKPDVKSPYQKNKWGSQNLVNCPYFKTDIHQVKQSQLVFGKANSFRILSIVKGAGKLHFNKENLATLAGDVWLIPADLDSFSIESSSEIGFLETKVV